MENKTETDVLLEKIKKDLINIVEQNEIIEKSEQSTTDVSKKNQTYVEENLSITPIWGEEKSSVIAIDEKPAIKLDPYRESLQTDVKKMQMELDKTYELFRNIGDKLESINLGNLESRIRQMHPNEFNALEKDSWMTDIKNLLDESFRQNRLDQLTKLMGEQFRKHPGEFGNIPEVSSIFQACTQLEKGMSQLKRQHNDAQELSERMHKAAEASYNRIDEIQKLIAEKREKLQKYLETN